MPFVIEKDEGEGKPPSFYSGGFGISRWVAMENAYKYQTEGAAQRAIDTGDDDLQGCIVIPYNEQVFEGSRTKSAAVESGMEVDRNQNAGD